MSSFAARIAAAMPRKAAAFCSAVRQPDDALCGARAAADIEQHRHELDAVGVGRFIGDEMRGSWIGRLRGNFGSTWACLSMSAKRRYHRTVRDAAMPQHPDRHVGLALRLLVGAVLPEGGEEEGRADYYATRASSTAELNAPFYRTPTIEAVQGWRNNTPDDFVFAWKASKFITHWKRLTERCDNSLELLEERVSYLGDKVGPILFQLPPQFHANRERLAAFVKMLNPKRRYTFEFRHASWYEKPILDLLRDNDIALCLSDHADAPAPWEVTASFVTSAGTARADDIGALIPTRP